MALTDSEEARVSFLEDTVNKLLIWLQDTISQKQFRQLQLIRQEELNTLEARIDELETKVALLQSTLNNMPITR